MLDLALAGSALMMGLAGTPHCLAMCGPAAAACGSGGRSAAGAFQLGRLLSYALGGAVVAASVGALAWLGGAAAWLRPLWLLVHGAALLLGLYLLVFARQPAWLSRIGRQAEVATLAPPGAGRVVLSAPARSGLVGLAWVAWPCGLLQSALLTAGLASGPAAGALVMASFAAASGAGLALGPGLLLKAVGARGMAWAVRAAGLALIAASGWALGHGVWLQVAALCGLPV
ncbi:sulfite exporter TauE/SafE family protein [Pelomonas sp. V22]|uniref:sulfite exporter TauE/SafE family protein n=1 Tax=Pelomonas sp. V22 TaxID=2822139 RepID=UPI0024A9885B|nr:sulfite exporter TauE/SafE family protein [Pelomonas sp. V22]MDI4632034.1 sulfite exporter TauE/SafE family protein [Pelomonas sp. V22]